MFKVCLESLRNCQIHKRKSAVCRQYGISVNKGFRKPKSQAALLTKFYRLAPNNFGPSAWNLLHITILTPKILKWLLDFLKFVIMYLRRAAIMATDRSP